ncbi:MAG: RND family transporter [Deltaproteobacteria bacterium]|nr:RND family transporter [Deltaproteobacteria bacterium]
MKRLIRFCVQYPYLIIAVVVCTTLFFLAQIPDIKIDPRVEVVLKENNPVEEVWNENKQEFESYADIIIGMLHDDIYQSDSLRKIQEISSEIEKIQGVKKVTSILNVKNIEGSASGLDVSPMITDGEIPRGDAWLEELREKTNAWEVYEGIYVTKDGKGTAISVVLNSDVETDDIVPIYYNLRDIMERYEGPEQFFISGPTIVEALQGHYMIKDLKILVPLVNIVLVFFLFLFFRNIRGVVLPLVSVGISSIWTVGLMPLLNIPLTMVTSVLPVALIAVGSAYGIHSLENVFSDAAEGKTGKEGIVNALSRVSLPVIMAGVTTIAAFISLCTSAIVPLKQFGALSGFGLFISVGISLTFLPAVLSILDSRGWEYVPHHHSSKDIIGPVLKWFTFVSLEKSSLIIRGSIVVLFLSVLLGLLVKSDLNLIEDFRKSSPIRIADQILNEKFGGTSLFNVVVSGVDPDDMKDPEVLRDMEQLQNRLKEHDEIGKAVSVVDFIKKMNQAMNEGDPAYYVIPDSKELIAQYLLLFSFSGGSGELDSFVNFDYQSGQIMLQMKSQSGYLAQDIVDNVNDFKQSELSGTQINNIFTTGLSMLAKEFNRLVVQSQIRSFSASFILVILIVSITFKSFKLGAYSVVPLFVPIVMNFGIMGLTGIRLNAATAIIASLAIGIGIDYSIHFLSRYRHEIAIRNDNERAIEISLNTSGRAILYNALAVAAGFLVLVPSSFVIISQLGILVALVMITTSVASITILPAMIKEFPPRLVKAKVPETDKTMNIHLVPQRVPSDCTNVVGCRNRMEQKKNDKEVLS